VDRRHIYLNNASIGPIPERTRRALDEFTAKRTAPTSCRSGAVRRSRRRPPRDCAPDQRRPVGDPLATNTVSLESGRARTPAEARRRGVALRQGIPGERISVADAAGSGITVEMARCRPEGWPDEEHLLQRCATPRSVCSPCRSPSSRTAIAPICRNSALPVAPTGPISSWTAFRVSATRCST